MKNFFVYLVLFSLSFNQLVLAVGRDDEPARYSQTVRSAASAAAKEDDSVKASPSKIARLTWGFRKIIYGALGCFGFRYAQSYTTEDSWYYSGCTAGNLVCVDLIAGGLYDIAHVCFDAYVDGVAFSSKRGMSKEERAARLSSPKYQAQRDEFWNRTIVLTRNLTNMSMTSVMMLRYLDQLSNNFKAGINPFGLTFPEGIECTSRFFCAPIATSLFMGVLGCLAAYQVHELRHYQKRAREKRADMPVIGFFSGWVETGVGMYFESMYPTPVTYRVPIGSPLEDYDMVKSMALGIFPDLATQRRLRIKYGKTEISASHLLDCALGIHGNSQMIANTWQGLLNGVYVIGAYFKRSALKTEWQKKITAVSPAPAPPSAGPRRLPITGTSRGPASYPPATGGTSKGKAEATEPLKREKTRGTPDELRSRERKQTEHKSTSSAAINEDRENQRLESLAAIDQEFSGRSAAKVTRIDELLREMIAFLNEGDHTAYIRKKDKKLEFFVRGQRVPFTVELPHDPADEYRGHKLDRVLTLIKIGYIADGDPQKLAELAAVHEIDRYPKVLFILLNRGRL